MWEVIVGVALTAVLGGILVPFIKGRIDRRAERFASSVQLVDTLSTSLWSYWKSALRIAYYGSKGRTPEYTNALALWDGDDAWRTGLEIQIQVSRAKRLLPTAAHLELDRTQREVVAFLDAEIDKRRRGITPAEWKIFYDDLMESRRRVIDSMLGSVVRALRMSTSEHDALATEVSGENQPGSSETR